VDILAAKYFSKTRVINFNNIKIKIIIKQKAFNISSIILIKEISKLIRSLLNRKALGLDSILNKILKIAALIIIKDLIKIASYYFTNRTILKNLKEFITVVLRKEGKKITLS